MQLLKQSTAATVVLGPFVDDTDGKTAETGLTISQADIRLSKNGGAFAQTNNAAGATHMENGYYSVPLDATDTNTLGRLTVAVSESGALPVWREFLVVPANVYDALVGGSDKLQVDAVEISSDSTAADNCESMFDGTGYAGGTTKLGVDVVAIGGTAQSATDLKDFADTGYDPSTHKVQGVVLTDTCTTNTDMRGTDNALLAASAPANFGDLAITATTGKVTVDNVDDCKADVSALALEATLTAMKGATFNEATDSLEAIRDRGDAAWITATGFSTHSAADVKTALEAAGSHLALIKAKTDNLPADPASATGPVGSVTGNVGGNVAGSVGSLAAQAKADVNAEVDAALADADLDHLAKVSYGAGKPADGSLFDQIMNKDAGQTFDPATDSLEAISDNMGGAVTDWSAGERQQIRDALGVDGTKTAATGGQLQAVKAKTDNLPADPADDSDIDTQLAAITTHLTDIKGGGWTTETLVALKGLVDDLETRLTAGRAAALDNLDAAITTRAAATVCTEARLSKLDAAISTRSSHAPADVKAALEAAGSHLALILEDTGTTLPATLALEAGGNLAAVKAKTDNLPADPASATGPVGSVTGSVGSVAADVGITQAGADKVWASAVRALTDKAGFELSAGGIDAIHDEAVEGALKHREVMRLLLAALAGLVSGGGTATLHFRDVADMKDRIIAVVDADGNRTAITLDVS